LIVWEQNTVKRNNAKLYLVNHLTSILPDTRFYRLKTILYQSCGFKIHNTARIVSSTKIIGTFFLEIGKDTFIGHDVLISGGDSCIKIGSYVDIAPRVCIVSGTHEIDMIGLHTAGKGVSKDIFIGDGVWIGTNSTIIGGVSIGKKSVIASGSVVINNIPEYVIAGGVPCKPLRQWNSTEKIWKNI